jgi:hypothetical protein
MLADYILVSGGNVANLDEFPSTVDVVAIRMPMAVADAARHSIPISIVGHTPRAFIERA